MAAKRRGSLLSVAAWVLICAMFVATLRIGLARDFQSTIGTENWGRMLFSIGAAITSGKHGGYGYTSSTVIETVLSYAGLTGDPQVLKSSSGLTFPDNLRDPGVTNAAIQKAIAFKWPFNPDEQIRGSGGEDLGLVDYVRVSFALFGYNVRSFYFTFFIILGLSVGVYAAAFWDNSAAIGLLLLCMSALIILFSSSLLDRNALGSITDPRFLSILAIIPAVHLALLMLTGPPPSLWHVGLAGVQACILVFTYWVRSSAIWTVLALTMLAAGFAAYAIWQRKPEQAWRIWSFGILVVVALLHLIYTSLALHPIYRTENDRAHHAIWHSLFYALSAHRDWDRRYSAEFDGATWDDLPEVAAKKYLLRHPPNDPGSVYLTEDKKHLRIRAADRYKRSAYLEFLARDPVFVAETIVIYNVGLSYRALTFYLSSLPQLSFSSILLIAAGLGTVAGLLAIDARKRQLFFWLAVLVTAAFFASMAPIIPTAPGFRTMADPYFLLLVACASWGVLAVSRLLMRHVGRDRPEQASAARR